MIKVCNRIIEYSFYALFLLVPLAFTSATSELFEMNKMWLTWALTIIIAMAWFTKMILQKKILLCRTPLDIPIALFLASQIISTIFSLDFHVSLWGYYSRFNGGLFSIISYVLLYYAFLSNFSAGDTTGRAPDSAHLSKAEGALAERTKEFASLRGVDGKVGAGPARMTKRLLSLSLVSGLIVALWGLPSHFGYDPTCLIFRGTLDVSCWTADFMPKIRIFSTLGQPDWLAAYLTILIPIAIAFLINSLKPNSSESNNKYHVSGIMYYVSNKKFILTTCYILLTTLFYVDLLYTRARSGFLGIVIPLILFFAAYFWIERKNFRSLINPLSLIIGLLLLITFSIGTPINQLNKFTLEGIGTLFQKVPTSKVSVIPTPTPAQSFESGGTESGDIRLLVWEGAINAWKNNPIFGTGVETFAFAYYKYKPIAHNLTSEWNFLYNKAHNEFLNYLATTGIFGLGTYLLMIGFFLTTVILRLKAEGSKILRSAQNDIVIFALIASYLSILITNFFGFSVVITNIYLFMIPAFVFVLTGTIHAKKVQIPTNKATRVDSTSVWQWTPIFFVLLIGFYMIINLFRFWKADINFALGYNLDRAGEYQKAYQNLYNAVKIRSDEPVFKDEFSINNAIIASGLISQLPKNQEQTIENQTLTVASTLAQTAINASNEVISQHSNNPVFWKTRVRLFFTLAQVDSRYLPRALDAIKKAYDIAPNDANISYNLGILYGQNNDIKNGIEALEKTVKLKPNYRDAHYGLGLFYHTLSLDSQGKTVENKDLNRKAIAQMQYILDNISPKDAGALESIEDWAK